MERHEYNDMSPAGQVEQWGGLAAGLKSNRPGRRRAAGMLVALAVLVLLGTGLVFLLA